MTIAIAGSLAGSGSTMGAPISVGEDCGVELGVGTGTAVIVVEIDRSGGAAGAGITGAGVPGRVIARGIATGISIARRCVVGPAAAGGDTAAIAGTGIAAVIMSDLGALGAAAGCSGGVSCFASGVAVDGGSGGAAAMIVSDVGPAGGGLDCPACSGDPGGPDGSGCPGCDDAGARVGMGTVMVCENPETERPAAVCGGSER